MSAETNLQLIQRWFQEVWNEGKTETVFDLLAPDAVTRGQGGSQAEIHGPEEFVQFVEGIRGAFPDLKVTIEDALAVDDKVAVRWSATMTHLGDNLGIPATGKSVQSTGISIARIVNGQFAEGWDNWDQLGMLRQIGAYKDPEVAPLGKTA
ncbi:MAG TPA: ester cyclase [Candidatus Sulfotelmatobacter sp.]|jgi:steroid delta-isomerase-like uncharacterized protein|nr:ester cyclase [Candidatus Sulfotelmatobacter sp.]